MSRILLNLHEAASKTPRELENTQMETAIDLTTVVRDEQCEPYIVDVADRRLPT